ncbi:MAG: rhomboid family intramembrane serine protease, partial [Thiobacillus sp.]|nr:rhomboid family intramembrane serine protease [Thiobacillus sp.]
MTNMDDDVSVAGDERFFASRKSQLGKARTNLWLGFAVVVAVVALVSGGSLQALALTVAVSLLILLPTDFALRKRMRAGQPLATLGDEAFESPNLTGKAKRCLWRDIERVTVASVQGTPYLQFHLRAPLGAPDRQSFWTGRNAARPTLLLSPFSAEDQERLLDGVERRLRRAAPDGAEPAVFGNELRQRQELQDRLKAMTPHTWATYALIAANLAVWLAMLSQGGGFLDVPADKLLLWGGNAASEVQRGEWWRLLTATFLHGGFVHVAMNMLGLLGAGILVERIYGKRLFLLVYFGSGLLGSALSLHFSAQEVVSVGASGAVFGVTGALLVAVWQHRDKLPKTFSKEMLSGIGFFVVYSLMQGFGKAGIDNAAHVGGLLGGCLIAYVLPERFDMDHFRRHYLSRALLALAAAGLATFGLAATAPRAVVDQA